MIRFTRNIKSFSGMGWGQIPTVNLTGGPTIQEIQLDTNDGAGNFLAPADINYVRLSLNGDVLIDVTGAQLRMLETYKGLFVEDGRFVIPLSDVSANTLRGQLVGGLVTFPSDTITLDVSLAAAGGRTWQPTLKASYEVTASEQARIWLPRIRAMNFDCSDAGWNDITTLPRGPRIQRAHLLGSVNELVVLKNRLNLFERTAPRNTYLLKRFGRVPQSGYYHFDPIASGFNQVEGFETADATESLTFRVNVTAAANIKCLLETVEQVAGAGATGANPKPVAA